MCRLFGMVASSPCGIRHWMLDCERPFRHFGKVHSHGWGIGWYERGNARLVKEAAIATDSVLFEKTASDAHSSITICHVRKATCGEQVLKNTHPFACGQWLFAHNGTIDGDYFISSLAESRRKALAGDTDSEVYFQCLLQAVENEGVTGLARAIAKIRERKFTALNFLLTDGHSLYVYWELSAAATPPYPDYYQLYYGGRPASGVETRQVIVCSECLDDNLWNRIPRASLLTVTSGLEIMITAV